MLFGYKKNLISGEVHITTRTASHFQSEKAGIKVKLWKVGFPSKVIESIMNNFNNADEELMIPR